MDKNITILKDKEQELEKAIERMSEQQPIDVDEAVTTTAPLYKQYVTQKFIVESKLRLKSSYISVKSMYAPICDILGTFNLL